MDAPKLLAEHSLGRMQLPNGRSEIVTVTSDPQTSYKRWATNQIYDATLPEFFVG
jgi:hypothetical protein